MRNSRSKKTANTSGRQSNLTLWIQHHRYAIRNVLNSVKRSRWTVIINSLILGLSLSLPLTLASVANHFDLFSANFRSAKTLYLQLEESTTDDARVKLIEALRDDARVESVAYWSREEVLERVLSELDIAPSSSLADINPFFNTISLTVAPDSGSATELGLFREQLETDVRVTHVEIAIHSSTSDMGSYLSLFQRFAQALSVIVLVSTLLICGYMVRNQILRQQLEIEVTRYCGGETAFIRRPFLYWGAAQGFLGAASAGVIVYLCFSFLSSPMNTLSNAPQTTALPAFFYLRELLATLVAGVLLGLVGAWVATKLHLNAIGHKEIRQNIPS